MKKNRKGLVAGLVVALVAIVVAMFAWSQPAQAYDIRPVYSVPNHAWYWSDTSVGTHTSAEAVDLAAFTGSPGYVTRVRIWNDDSTNDLMVYAVPYGTSMPTSNMTTPSNGVASQVLVLKPGDDGAVGFLIEGKYRGIYWQSRTSNVAGRIVAEY